VTCSSSADQASNKGVALIIVLAFVVLLSGLVVAYLTRAGIDRQLANQASKTQNLIFWQ
jgi:type II secretory pathway component PulK